MSQVTEILSRIESGDDQAAVELFPLVYLELRRLAAARMAAERVDHTLQPTALVHEAFVRLVDIEQTRLWQSRSQFFASAAEAMRRILVDHARNHNRQKRGGNRERELLTEVHVPAMDYSDELLAIDEVIDQLAKIDPIAADITKLRYFAGMTVEEVAEALSISRATAYRLWSQAKAWLQCELCK